MKKLLFLFALCAFAAPSFAATATDPLYMLKTGGMLVDSQLGYNDNYQGADGGRYWQLLETFKYGITDGVEVYGSLGIANLKDGDYKETGLTDPELGVKWRALPDMDGAGMVLDLGAYFSPSFFDSPNDNDGDGAAKGSTDFGINALIGKQLDVWTWAGFLAADFIGSSDRTKSGTDLRLGGLGKYYIDDLNSLDGALSLNFYDKRVDGGDSDTSLKIQGGYSRVLNEYVDLSAFLGFATHSADESKGESFLGAKLRLVF